MLLVGKAVGESTLYTFTNAGLPVRGVVHVGANVGQEMGWYLANRLLPILCFEPVPLAYDDLVATWGGYSDDVEFVNCALGEEDGTLTLQVPVDLDTQRVSRYNPLHLAGHEWTDIPMGKSIEVPVYRFDSWVRKQDLYLPPYNALSIDTQGMEMEVLRGFGDLLDGFDYLCVEMSAKPVYDGEVPAGEVIAWLEERGFKRETPIEEHDDVLFRRR